MSLAFAHGQTPLNRGVNVQPLEVVATHVGVPATRRHGLPAVALSEGSAISETRGIDKGMGDMGIPGSEP